MRRPPARFLALLVVVLCGSPGLAHAQAEPAPPPDQPTPYDPAGPSEPMPPDDGQPPPEPYYAPPAPVGYQPPPAAPVATVRDGIFIGLGLGGGNLRVRSPGGDVASDYGSLLYDLHFGGLINPRLGIGLSVWGSSHSERDDFTGSTLDILQTNLGAFAQYWVLERLWLRGGLGSARLASAVDGTVQTTFKGASVAGSLGYEVMHTQRYALDLAIGLWAANFKGNDVGATSTGTFQLLFTWY